MVKTLGSGGMAEVHLALDDVLNRDVALKVLDRRYMNDEEFVERFKREAQSAAALSHPNIVSIYDRGEAEDGACYIAMEYISRGTLKDRIKRAGRLDTRAAAGVALQMAEALSAAHEERVIHRDIKPQNVLVTARGDVKVADFGIARAASSPSITRESLVLGTAAYMSPEQATGGRVGPTSDLYSLGVVMYEMLTGELPYKGGDFVAVAAQHANAELRPPKALNPEIPEEMNALVVALLSKNPHDRPASADELISELRRLLKDPPRAPKSQSRESEPARSRATRSTVAYPQGRVKRPERPRTHPGRGRTRPGDLIPWLLAVLFVVGVIVGGLLVLRVLGAPLP